MNEPADFTQRQHDYLVKSLSSWFNVAEGGKRGGKNVLQTMAFCIALEEHPDKIHLVAGVSTSTARLNILDCDGYGLLNFFDGRSRTGKYQNRDCVYVASRTGEKVVLVSGGGKSGDEKLIKGNTYGMAYITEANECAPIFLKEVFDRTISSSDRKIFHDLNPKAPTDWYYETILDFHEEKQKQDSSYGYNYGHFTIADNLSISDEQLKKVLDTYDKESVWYLRDIRGYRKKLEGLIYTQFDEKVHMVNTSELKYTRFYISCDYGTQNPFSLGLWGLSQGIWYRIKEFYYDGRKNNKQKTDEEYYQDLDRLAGDKPIKSIIIDPSAASFIACIRKHGKFTVRQAKNAVLDGIRNTATALEKKMILFDKSCTASKNEFGLYSWDEKATEDKPLKENDHAMDDIRYFVHTVLFTDSVSKVKIHSKSTFRIY